MNRYVSRKNIREKKKTSLLDRKTDMEDLDIKSDRQFNKKRNKYMVRKLDRN